MKRESTIAVLFSWKMWSWMAVTFLQIPLARGQHTDMVVAHFAIDSVAIDLGSTFTNFLVIENTGNKTITIPEISPHIEYPGLILSPRSEGILQAGEIRRFPVKFIANLEFLKMETDQVKFDMTFVTDNVVHQKAVSFTVLKKEDRTIPVQPFSRAHFIPPGTAPSTLRFILENRTYSRRNLQLDITMHPEGLEITPSRQTVTLEAMEKRTVEIQVANPRHRLQTPEHKLELTVTDLANQKVVGQNMMQVVFLSSDRPFGRESVYAHAGNFGEIQYNQHSTGLSYVNLRGHSALALTNKLTGRWNLAADIYQAQGLYNLYDTWIEVEGEHAGLRLGNVYSSEYDYSVSGRGGKLILTPSNGREIEIFGLENNYNLYGTYFPQREGSRMAGAKYSFGDPEKWMGKVSYLFDHNPYLSTKTNIANYISSFTHREQHHFSLEAGLSHEKGLLNGDQHPGASLGLHYHSRIGSWDLQSINSFATAAYAGLSRGAYHFNQRVGLDLAGGQRLFLQYQNARVAPKYLSFQRMPDDPFPDQYPGYLYRAQAVKTGLQLNPGNWTMLLSPQIEYQQNTSGTSDYELLSYRFHVQTGTTIGPHGFSLTGEYAYSSASGRDWFHGLKTNLSYRLRNFSIMGSAQWNPANVIDLNAYNYENEDFVNYNLYASYNFHAFRDKLTGYATAGFNYSQLYGSIYQNVMLNLEYRISPSWALSAYVYSSAHQAIPYTGTGGHHSQFRLGLKKYFPSGAASGNHKVQILVFGDANFNEILDPEETTLPHVVVNLGNHVAITGPDGVVTFRNVPKGNYSLQISGSTSHSMLSDPQVVVDGNVRKEVGISEYIRVTGRLSEVRHSYDRVESDVTGMVVYARNGDGHIRKAVVNEESAFEFFLQSGQYDLFVENDRYHFSDPVQQIEVDNAEEIGPIVFEYRKKGTTIKVKTF